jgi:uncharacterized protein
MKTHKISVHGMHCAGCELTIENQVSQLPGILFVNADYENDQVTVDFDESQTSLEAIVDTINNAGYEPELAKAFAAVDQALTDSTVQQRKQNFLHSLKKAASIVLALLGIGLILWLDTWFMSHADMPKFGRDISYGLLFLIGFLTSFHCVGMCGPLILGYATKTAQAGHQSHLPHLLYGIGKTISYTLIGAAFGAFGSIIAFTPATQGAVGIAAGVFLILYGLHMLEAFTLLRHFQIRTPAFWTRVVGEEYRKHSNPFIIGLLNGLMIICGPLQAMYVMAAGTGNWLDGATILFFFGLGTLPLLMGFGMLTSLLSTNLTPKLLKASGYVVMVLGAIMLNRGLTVTGSGADFNTMATRISQQFSPEKSGEDVDPTLQIITMDVLRSGFSPNKFTLRQGVPVQWVINGKEINECNKAIVVPQYNLTIQLQPGIQTIEFTPKETGVVPWSCWMGMIPGTFIVVEDSLTHVKEKTAKPLNTETGHSKTESDVQHWLKIIINQWEKMLSQSGRN